MNRTNIFRATIDQSLAPVDSLRRDDSVSEIMINGPDEIFVERRGRIERTDARFDDEDTLLAIARNIAQFTNKRITEATARFDSRLPDGSRVHVVMPKCAGNRLCMAIRKFSRSGFTLEGLLESQSLTPEAKEYLEVLVGLEKNIIVSGGTGSGKTSFLNALSLKIPPAERIIVIEDTSELRLKQPHVLCFETAPPDRYGRDAVTIRDLFHSALRMRPDRIVIGECRGGEALDLLQALTSGHGGSMSTLHANTPGDAMSRLETMALMSGVEIPLAALRRQIASAIDIVVQLNRLADGTRVVAVVSEVVGLDSRDQYELNSIFVQDDSWSGTKSKRPRLRSTGATSIFAELVAGRSLGEQLTLTKRIFSPASGSDRPAQKDEP